MNKASWLSIFATLAITAGQALMAQSASPPVKPADNTRSNQTDSSNRNATAEGQKQNATDLALTRNIRRSIIADKELSTYAHNVKVVAIDGQVTLNGVVRSDDERSKVAQMAEKFAGAEKVTNNIKVTPTS